MAVTGCSDLGPLIAWLARTFCPPEGLFPRDVSETGELLFEVHEGPPVDAVAYHPPLFADDLAA